MKLHKLETISLSSSSVAGSTYNEYASGTTYSIGNNVKVSFEDDGTTPRFPVVEYVSLSGSNTGNYPPDNPASWSEIGAENRCKMFDAYINTQTEDTDDIEVTISANGVSSVGIFNIYGTSVELVLKRSGVTITSETVDLRTLIPESGWYSWLFDSYEYGIDQVIWTFPRYISNATLEITITARSSLAKCGLVCVGNHRDLGITRYGVSVGIDDYSIKDTDTLGRTYLNQGEYANRADISMTLLNTNIDYVMRQLADVRGEAAIFDANNVAGTYQSAAIYGFWQNFDITVPGPIRSQCNLEIKGLI